MDLMRKDLPNKYLLLVDICGITISFLLTAWIVYGSITYHWFNNYYNLALATVIFLYIAIYYLFDTYSKLFKRGYLEEMITVIKINVLLAVTLTVVMFLFQEGATYSRLFFLLFFLLNILITYIL